MADDIGWAMVFFAVVGLMIAVGVVIGIIVAGRIDRLMAPKRPGARDDAPPPPEEDRP
jgi:hypothetical protein